MTIVTMATESYMKWLYHMLNSLEDTIPQERVMVFLINYEKQKVRLLKKQFPQVYFQEEKKQLILKKEHNPHKNIYLVTYLKGEFMEKAFNRFGEPNLWIDCTALIRRSPQEIGRAHV